MTNADNIIKELSLLATEEKQRFLPRFFKTGKGQYGEGDIFLGVIVPHTRIIARKYADIDKSDILKLLNSEYHEVRLCALLIMVRKCQKGNDNVMREMFNMYLKHTDRINNWDLVDLSAPMIVGNYLVDKSHDILYRLAESKLLWDNRIAIVSTISFIRRNEFDDTYNLALKMMNHPHDLIHKAIGWMLREAGKRNPRRLYEFVDTYRTEMPRTMLRYAIEKFSKEEKKWLMRK
ncbi:MULTISPECIES: DNA alkylation repair protein [Bacteroidales]|jgi:3-methyladenine DNA glycosylase AlkD|uniref:DNA alkylation repair protein n=1 Tax=Bacteroidales TaxID=171549 RepID=UPI000CE9E046|nr:MULTISPECIES: DNA alkylation repair protein [Bacteroidales]GAY28681.1 DNA alkylation repair protein [Prevotella sp. MGM1]